MRRPETRYARSDGRYVAWQAFGDGPRDILFVSSWATNIDAMWDEPSCALYFGRLARIGRVICFDKRGTGVSDRFRWRRCRRSNSGWTTPSQHWMRLNRAGPWSLATRKAA